MPKPSAAEWIRLVTESAEKLRAVGVHSMKLDGCEVVLTPLMTPYEPGKDVTIPVGKFEEPGTARYTSALDDPASFPGGRMPTLRRRDG